jgi:uncharacterized DUF497 family protein
MPPITFEWDKGNQLKSSVKHNISPNEAETIFSDSKKVIYYDKKHSGAEIRYICIGKSGNDNVLTCYFTNRSGKVRIIGARKSNRIERATYETVN